MSYNSDLQRPLPSGYTWLAGLPLPPWSGRGRKGAREEEKGGRENARKEVGGRENGGREAGPEAETQGEREKRLYCGHGRKMGVRTREGGRRKGRDVGEWREEGRKKGWREAGRNKERRQGGREEEGREAEATVGY